MPLFSPLHYISPLPPFPPYLLHNNYFPAQRLLQATPATMAGPTALAGHCIIYLWVGSRMDTLNPQRLGRPLNVTKCIVWGSFGHLDPHQGSLDCEWLKAKWCPRTGSHMRGSSSLVCNEFRNIQCYSLTVTLTQGSTVKGSLWRNRRLFEVLEDIGVPQEKV